MSLELPEELISIEMLSKLFKSTSFEPEISEKGDLYVPGTQSEIIVKVTDTDEQKFITFITYKPFRPEISKESRLEWINELNSDNLMVRFSIMGDKHLYCDYQFSFQDGILAESILNTFRRFDYVVGALFYPPIRERQVMLAAETD